MAQIPDQIRQKTNMTAASKPIANVVTTPAQVLIYIPNIIGYTRVAFALISFVLLLVSPSYWRWGIAFYLANFAGDLFDGWAARRWNQCSSWGSVLDMVTDRCGTTGFLYVLGNQSSYVSMRLSCLGLLILDVASHWVQMHSSLALGVHHKSIEGNQKKNILVRWFYQHYAFFGYLCVGAEFTYICGYIVVLGHEENGLVHDWECTLAQIVLLLSSPGWCAKQIVNIAQLASSAYAIAEFDAQQTIKYQ